MGDGPHTCANRNPMPSPRRAQRPGLLPGFAGTCLGPAGRSSILRNPGLAGPVTLLGQQPMTTPTSLGKLSISERRSGGVRLSPA